MGLVGLAQLLEQHAGASLIPGADRLEHGLKEVLEQRDTFIGPRHPQSSKRSRVDEDGIITPDVHIDEVERVLPDAKFEVLRDSPATEAGTVAGSGPTWHFPAGRPVRGARADAEY